MRILYVTNSAKTGGAENHVLQLINGMVANGHEVFITCPWGEMVKKYFDAGAHVRIDTPSFDIDIFYIIRLMSFMRRENVEILHAHQLKTVVNSLIAASFARIPARVVHVHSPISGWQIPIYKKILDLIINFAAVNFLADVAIALTEATKGDRVRGEHIREGKIRVIPNGIDIEKFKSQKSKIKVRREFTHKYNLPIESVLVGTLNRLTEEKGVDVLIKAIAEIPSDKLKRVHFVIAGEGLLRENLVNLANTLQVGDKVTFLGFVPDEDFVSFYTSLDLFVFPSLHEGFGYVLAEAMVAGVPTLSSDLEVLKELTGNGKFGYHFAKGDYRSLATAILEVLDTLDRAKSISEKASLWVKENFGLDKFIKNYENLYRELLA